MSWIALHWSLINCLKFIVKTEDYLKKVFILSLFTVTLYILPELLGH